MSHGGHRSGAGRKAGSKTQYREEVSAFYYSIISEPAYKQRLHDRAVQGELAPQIEVMVHHYALGKPIEQRAVDDAAFFDDLMRTVWQYVSSTEGREAIRAVIEAHLGRASVRIVA